MTRMSAKNAASWYFFLKSSAKTAMPSNTLAMTSNASTVIIGDPPGHGETLGSPTFNILDSVLDSIGAPPPLMVLRDRHAARR